MMLFRRVIQIRRRVFYAIAVPLLVVVLFAVPLVVRSAKPDSVVAGPAVRLQPANWPASALTVANLGHATLLMN